MCVGCEQYSKWCEALALGVKFILVGVNKCVGCEQYSMWCDMWCEALTLGVNCILVGVNKCVPGVNYIACGVKYRQSVWSVTGVKGCVSGVNDIACGVKHWHWVWSVVGVNEQRCDVKLVACDAGPAPILRDPVHPSIPCGYIPKSSHEHPCARPDRWLNSGDGSELFIVDIFPNERNRVYGNRGIWRKSLLSPKNLKYNEKISYGPRGNLLQPHFVKNLLRLWSVKMVGIRKNFLQK